MKIPVKIHKVKQKEERETELTILKKKPKGENRKQERTNKPESKITRAKGESEARLAEEHCRTQTKTEKRHDKQTNK